MWHAFSPVLGGLRWPLLALFVVMQAGLALHAVPPLLGVAVHAVRLVRRRHGVLASPACSPLEAVACGHGVGTLLRTAIVMPVCNEDPARVFATVGAVRLSLCEAGLDAVDLHVLSDTTLPHLAAEEERRFAAAGGDSGLFYRRRQRNAGRKVGNIAEFCTRCRHRYELMVVLDADSLIAGRTIARLIARMQAEPRTGMIQTIPYAVNRETLFARMTQFAMRLYTPLWAEGAVLWQGDGANYWGHNAIIRIAPFLDHCALPVLPGRAPLGGEILCHDVVEAALMQAAGWHVHLDPTLTDTFEEVPPNLIDHIARERRWCQGNLQHLRVLAWPQLRLAGRVHLGSGLAYYLAGPIWVAFALLLSLAPTGPADHLGAAALVSLLGTMVLPRALSLAATLASRERSASFGGRLPLLVSALLDQAFTVALVPLTMLTTTHFVAATLCGRSIGWNAQQRCDRGVGWTEAARLLWLYPAAVGVWAAGLLVLQPSRAPLVLPVLAALLGSPVLAVWTSRLGLGRGAARWALFCTADELAPTRDLRVLRRSMSEQRGDPANHAAARRPAHVLPAALTVAETGFGVAAARHTADPVAG